MKFTLRSPDLEREHTKLCNGIDSLMYLLVILGIARDYEHDADNMLEYVERRMKSGS